MADIPYPFDVTGVLPANKILDEMHTLTRINGNPYRIIIPKFAPFYLDNFKITYTDALGVDKTLAEDVDYHLCLPYLGGSRSIGKMLYGGITLNNLIINGSIKITYQILGGKWIADVDYILGRLAETLYNPRITVWDVVTDKTDQFPPINHDHHMDFVYGHGSLIESINKVATSVITGASGANSLLMHIANDTNPHRVDKQQVGLTDVVNLPMATDAEVASKTPVNKYITLKQVLDIYKSSFSAVVKPVIAEVTLPTPFYTYKTNNIFMVVTPSGVNDETAVPEKPIWKIRDAYTRKVVDSGEGVYDGSTRLSTWKNNIELTTGVSYILTVEYRSVGAIAAISDDVEIVIGEAPVGAVVTVDVPVITLPTDIVVPPPVTPVVTVDTPVITLPTDAVVLNIGDPYEGGYYAGVMVDGTTSYRLIVSPRIGGQYGADAVTIGGEVAWKTDTLGVSPVECESMVNGLAATNAMIAANTPSVIYPAANFARAARELGGVGLSGKNDWYIPARDELEVLYRVFKPDGNPNTTNYLRVVTGYGGDGKFYGENEHSSPTGSAYTVDDPKQTNVLIFQNDGGEELFSTAGIYYWSSSANSDTNAWRQFSPRGSQSTTSKTNNHYVRLVRRVAI